MNIKEFASMLNGREIGGELSRDEAKQAKSFGFVVVYGASDDLMEFDGAITEEVCCFDGGTVYFDRDGLFPMDDACDECKMYQRALKACKTIEALWDSENGFSWSYKTDIAHETFDIMEDGEPYCRGVVFDMAALGGGEDV